MRRSLVPRPFLAVSATAVVLGLTLAACSSVDKAQSCLEDSKVITETISKVTAAAQDPEAMDKALRDAAGKLRDAADKAGNTTANEALQDLADTLGKLDVDDVNDAVDAAQKVATEGAATAKKLAENCT
jgi:hypothetical protein